MVERMRRRRIWQVRRVKTSSLLLVQSLSPSESCSGRVLLMQGSATFARETRDSFPSQESDFLSQTLTTTHGRILSCSFRGDQVTQPSASISSLFHVPVPQSSTLLVKKDSIRLPNHSFPTLRLPLSLLKRLKPKRPPSFPRLDILPSRSSHKPCLSYSLREIHWRPTIHKPISLSFEVSSGGESERTCRDVKN